MAEKPCPLEWVVRELTRLHHAGFYGKLLVELRAGEVVLVRKEETLKPPTEEPARGVVGDKALWR